VTTARAVLPLLFLLLVPACRSTGDGATHAPVSRRALLDGQLIHYLDAGGDSDEALVLIHGWASSTVSWRHQFPALAEHARVLKVDLIGHGRSEFPRGDFTLALMADSVLAAMDDAGVARAVLVGHSNGVPLMLLLAEQPTWDDDYAAWVKARAPQVDYRVWTDIGHYMQMERPDEVRDAIVEFLDDNALLR
jgi:pimeloyl-ACP methyl ester carboxylesterase